MRALFFTAFAVYALAVILEFTGTAFKKEKLLKAAWYVFVAAFALNNAGTIGGTSHCEASSTMTWSNIPGMHGDAFVRESNVVAHPGNAFWNWRNPAAALSRSASSRREKNHGEFALRRRDMTDLRSSIRPESRSNAEIGTDSRAASADFAIGEIVARQSRRSAGETNPPSAFRASFSLLFSCSSFR